MSATTFRGLQRVPTSFPLLSAFVVMFPSLYWQPAAAIKNTLHRQNITPSGNSLTCRVGTAAAETERSGLGHCSHHLGHTKDNPAGAVKDRMLKSNMIPVQTEGVQNDLLE